ncbi:MAG: flavodoxin [Alphaproteobacteria bacterium]
MLKYIVYLILILAVIGGAIGAFHLYRVSVKNKKEMSQYKNEEIVYNNNLGKVLVVYYSLSGHTKEIADKIVAKTNADIYEIKTIEEIKQNAKLHFTIKNQLKNKNYPDIKKDFPNFEEYDVIFVGAPVWWYKPATPLFSFLNQADFQGKKVVPFSTQGSNVGTFEEDFKENIKDAQILKYEKFNNLSKEYDKEVENKITTWLNEL